MRRALERLTLQRLDPARSVLYHAGTPTSWNLDFYGRSRVGRTAFGTDRIPDGWAERCNALDEIWVPNEFNRETFTASGVDAQKVRVLRTGVDTQRFRPGSQPLARRCRFSKKRNCKKAVFLTAVGKAPTAPSGSWVYLRPVSVIIAWPLDTF